MVKEIGDLLLLPNLEEETVKEINATIRHMVQQYRGTTTQGPVGINPFSRDLKVQAENLLGTSVVDEWLNGPTKEGE